VTLAGRLAAVIDGLHPERRILVGIDGPDAAGKTTLARLVHEQLRRPSLPASIDAWHQPRDVRLRRGDESADGCYRDSFDYQALKAQLLTPFRAGASSVTVAAFDHVSDRVDVRTQSAGATTVLLFDGVFLLRPELRTVWDLSVYLHVPESVSIARAMTRDRAVLGDEDRVSQRYQRRYLPGQAIYRRESRPQDVADIVIDNSDASDPQILRWTPRP
jgi:uridine kinase